MSNYKFHPPFLYYNSIEIHPTCLFLPYPVIHSHPNQLNHKISRSGHPSVVVAMETFLVSTAFSILLRRSKSFPWPLKKTHTYTCSVVDFHLGAPGTERVEWLTSFPPSYLSDTQPASFHSILVYCCGFPSPSPL